MITAIIRNKENTLVLELPHSIYDIYEKLQSIGIRQPPKQIPLTDNEDEGIGVKLFSESDFGQHLLLTLNEKSTIADANMLTNVIQAASEDIKEELEQNILYDQYDSMNDVINAVRQMTQDVGPVKAVFFCPLIGNIDEGDGDMFTVGDSYLADSTDEISDALKEYTANDENDMAAYYNEDDGVSEKLTSAIWSVELHGDRLFGRIDCSLKETLTVEETEALRDWLTGQCSDGLGEGFEQQPIDTMDGELFVSFWNSGDDYAMMTESEFDEYLSIQLIEQGHTEVAYETIVSGGTQSGNKYTAAYSFSQVPAGTYTMKVSKANHVTREYTVTVGAAAVTQDVEIWLLGDVTGDGKINMKDIGLAYDHFNKKSLLTDYAFSCADIDGNKKVNMKDIGKMYDHFNKMSKLW